MTSNTNSASASDTSAVDGSPSFAAAGRLIDGLAVRDFGAIAATFTDDVRFRAVLPKRILDLESREAARAAFETWFATAEHWELVEAVLGEVGGRVHLRWRLRVTKPELGPGTFIVEQQVYADADADGTLRDVALLCTGFRPGPS